MIFSTFIAFAFLCLPIWASPTDILNEDSIYETLKRTITTSDDKAFFETDLSSTVIEELLSGDQFTTRSLARRISYERRILPIEWRNLIANTKEGEECGQMCMVAASIGMYDAFKYAVHNCKPSATAIKYAPLASIGSLSSLAESKKAFVKKWINDNNPSVTSLEHLNAMKFESTHGELLDFSKVILGNRSLAVSFINDINKHFRDFSMVDYHGSLPELLNVEAHGVMPYDKTQNLIDLFMYGNGNLEELKKLIDAGAPINQYFYLIKEENFERVQKLHGKGESFDHLIVLDLNGGSIMSAFVAYLHIQLNNNPDQQDLINLKTNASAILDLLKKNGLKRYHECKVQRPEVSDIYSNLLKTLGNSGMKQLAQEIKYWYYIS